MQFMTSLALNLSESVSGSVLAMYVTIACIVQSAHCVFRTKAAVESLRCMDFCQKHLIFRHNFFYFELVFGHCTSENITIVRLLCM